ncbi:MAG: signal peptidase II [Bacteroidetes bacterium]|nr:signal peptidase II [Bacteroidota bacterium]
MKNRLGLVAILVTSLLIIDQVVKIWVKTSFSSDEVRHIFGTWFSLHYIENQGMAFGTTFGSGMWHKLALSIFRILAIGFIIYYIVRESKKVEIKTEYLMAVGLILSGAAGNLIDSMVYDFIFSFNPCEGFNQLPGSGNFMNCKDYGFEYQVEVRHKGFLLANVVDMFQFEAYWPKWVPVVGGGQVFPAIWNVADSCISVGIGWIIIRQRTFFPKKKEVDSEISSTEEKLH